jgi:hypothetical protein
LQKNLRAVYFCKIDVKKCKKEKILKEEVQVNTVCIPKPEFPSFGLAFGLPKAQFRDNFEKLYFG